MEEVYLMPNDLLRQQQTKCELTLKKNNVGNEALCKTLYLAKAIRFPSKFGFL